MADLSVEHIACVNQGGFVMSFKMQSLGDVYIGDSGTYPVGQTRVIDVPGDSPLAVGSTIWPHVYIGGGPDRLPVPDDYVRFARNGQTATYTVDGTTFDSRVVLVR